MALETVSHISDLVAANPVNGDPVSEGNEHIQNIKTALKTDFPNIDAPVTATPAELNRCDITTLGKITANEVVTADGSGNIDCNNANFTNVDIDTGTIAGAVTGVTQSANDNSTKLATTAYADGAVGADYYESGGANPTPGSALDGASRAVPVAHGLGGAPEIITAYAVCTTNDSPYVVGDRVNCSGLIHIAGPPVASYGIAVVADATNYWATVADTGLAWINENTGLFFTPDPSDWEAHVVLAKLP